MVSFCKAFLSATGYSTVTEIDESSSFTAAIVKLKRSDSSIMPHKLKPIKPKRISDQVFDQLRELIFRGEFKAGKKYSPSGNSRKPLPSAAPR